MNSTITEKPVYLLVHMASVPPFTESSVCFASQAALNIIVEKKGPEAKRRMALLLVEYEVSPLITPLYESVFEPYALELRTKGGTRWHRKRKN